MKTIATWEDLTAYGIVPLTGESCGLMYRILCDVTVTGRKTIQKCFGLPDLSLSANWNQGREGDRHVGSVLLAPEMIVPLGVFGVLESGCIEAWVSKGTVIGIEPGDNRAECVEWIKQWLGTDGLRRYAYQGTAGDRNVHQMTGRAT